ACSPPHSKVSQIPPISTALVSATIAGSQSQKNEYTVPQISQQQHCNQKEVENDSTTNSTDQQSAESIFQISPTVSSQISESTTSLEHKPTKVLNEQQRKDVSTQTLNDNLVDSEELFEVIADYFGQKSQSNFLPVQKGEIVKVIEKGNKFFTIIFREGQIPKEFLRVCPSPFTSSSLNELNSTLPPKSITKQNIPTSEQLSYIQTPKSNIQQPNTHGEQAHRTNSDPEVIGTSMSAEELQEQIEQLQYNDFELIRELSSGAFGRVIVVKFKFADIIIAIKRVPYKHPVKIQLADQEIKMLKIAQSRYTVRLFGTFKFDLDLCMLQEFCPGGNLRGQLEKMKSMSIKERMELSYKYTFQIVSGLQILHSSNIAHRDLKPENILIDKDGNAKLADFGLAEKIESKSYLKTAGTFNYAPPEAFSQNRMMIESDIWAVGVIVTELVTGVHPFTGRNSEEISTKIRDGKFAPLPDHVQGEMKQMIVKMLSVDMTKRPTVEKLLQTELMKHQAQIEEVADDEKIAERLVAKMIKNRKEIEMKKQLENKKAEAEAEKTRNIENENKNLQQLVDRSNRLKIGQRKFQNYERIEKIGSAFSADSKIKVGGLILASQLLHGEVFERSQFYNLIYVSPERYANDIQSCPADIYGIGLIMHEILTQVPPFEDGSRHQLKYWRSNGQVQVEIDKQRYSSDLVELISSMRRVNPDERPTPEQILAHPLIHHIIQNNSETFQASPMLVWGIDSEFGYASKEQNSLLVAPSDKEGKIHSIKLVVPDGLHDHIATMGLDPVFQSLSNRQQFIRISARFIDQPQGSFRKIGIVEASKDISNDYELGMDEYSISYDGTSGQITHGGQIVCTNDKFENDDIVQLELCVGGTLEDYYKNKKEKEEFITGKEALKFLYQMISAIKYLHSKRILHRNLNPSQILLTYDNTIKESGLSIAMKLDPGKDSDKTICNTNMYMSPEQTSTNQQSFPADVYGIGLIMHEILSQTRPFETCSQYQLIQRRLNGKVQADIDSQHYSSDLIQLVDSMHRIKPEERPTVEQILAHPLISQYLQQMSQDIDETHENAAFD
ncbi:MAG: putative protein kinase, cAMP-dependent, catalytic chain, partial [Streblomastix strix]